MSLFKVKKKLPPVMELKPKGVYIFFIEDDDKEAELLNETLIQATRGMQEKPVTMVYSSKNKITVTEIKVN